MNERWQDVRMQFIDAVQCPYCGSLRKPITVRSARCRDQSVCRKSVCRDCSRRFLVIVEPPAADWQDGFVDPLDS